MQIIIIIFFNPRNVEKQSTNFDLSSRDQIILERSDLFLNDHEYIYLARYTAVHTDISDVEKNKIQGILRESFPTRTGYLF